MADNAALCVIMARKGAAMQQDILIIGVLFPAIPLMMGSMLLFTREIQIANTALDVHLSDLESHQEWEQYLKPNRRRRAATKS